MHKFRKFPANFEILPLNNYLCRLIFIVMTRKALIFSAVFLALLACSKEEFTGTQEKAPSTEGYLTDGSIMVKFSEELTAMAEEACAQGKVYTKSMSLNSVFDELGVTAMERIFPYAGEYEERTRREGLHQWYSLAFESTKAPAEAKKELEAVDGILNVELPRKVKRTSLPNDSYFNLQWYLYNDGKANYTGKENGRIISSNKGCDINVTEVWDNFTKGSSNVVVAVVDGGIDVSHPELSGVVLTDKSHNFYANSSNISKDSHGTFVAGIIAALSNNGTGVAGIAGGDVEAGVEGVKLLSCQIFEGEESANYGSMGNAIKWGADHGAVISQNSWGNVYDTDEDGIISDEELQEASKDKIDDVTKAGIDYFIKYAGCDNDGNQLPDSPMKGGIVVFAAGNEAIEYGVPAYYEPVIAVGAVGPDYGITWYSNCGDWVDIAAPGGDGLSSDYVTNFDSKGYSRGCIYNLFASKYDELYDYTNYGYMSGTSMACPMVSGVCALLLSYFGGQGVTPDDIKKRLFEGANYEHLNTKYPIGPVLDAYGAFTYGNFPPVAKKEISNVLLYVGGDSWSCNLNDYFKDDDGDKMTFSLVEESSYFSAAFTSDGTMSLKGTAPGLTSASVRATDEGGAHGEQSFSVLVKDPNNPVDLEPEAVSKTLTIRTENETLTHVIITNASGKVMRETTQNCSGFSPMELDLSNLAPGRYGISVSYDGKTYNKQFVKI